MMVGPCTLEFWRLMTLVIMTTSAKVTAQVCPVAGYVIFNGVCYKHFAERKTYDDARQTCAADGGLVAMPKDNATNTFIHNLGPLSHYWIGLTDVDNEGQWVFEDGQTLESSGFSNWYPGEPNDEHGREDCTEVGTSEHFWNDIPCTGTKEFVCQRVCPVAGYVIFNGVCYKHFAERKTYDDARQTCAADGGLVAMPKDNAINNFIHNLGPLSHYWIGLTDVDNEGQWVFEDGQTLESSGFSNWQPGEPNDALGREDCAEVLPSEHVWNDIPCTGTKRFVCQQISGLSGMTLDDAGMGHLSVSWTVVEGLPISRYRLRYQPADGSGSYRDLSPAPAVGATSATVRGLQADTDYNITLTSFGEDDQPNGVISGTYTTGPTTTHTYTTPRAQTEGPTTSPHLTGPIASPAVGAAMPSTYPTTTHTYTTPRAQTEVAATGTIVGIVIGVIAAIALTVALVYIFTRKMICGKGDEEHADVAPPVRSSSRRRTDNIYAVPMDTYHLPS
ncbi:uncharacterized protein LOC144863758 [Branchiostoma floridae x Branchiostoma japonicum]